MTCYPSCPPGCEEKGQRRREALLFVCPWLTDADADALLARDGPGPSLVEDLSHHRSEHASWRAAAIDMYDAATGGKAWPGEAKAAADVATLATRVRELEEALREVLPIAEQAPNPGRVTTQALARARKLLGELQALADDAPPPPPAPPETQQQRPGLTRIRGALSIRRPHHRIERLSGDAIRLRCACGALSGDVVLYAEQAEDDAEGWPKTLDLIRRFREEHEHGPTAPPAPRTPAEGEAPSPMLWCVEHECPVAQCECHIDLDTIQAPQGPLTPVCPPEHREMAAQLARLRAQRDAVAFALDEFAPRHAGKSLAESVGDLRTQLSQVRAEIEAPGGWRARAAALERERDALREQVNTPCDHEEAAREAERLTKALGGVLAIFDGHHELRVVEVAPDEWEAIRAARALIQSPSSRPSPSAPGPETGEREPGVGEPT